MAKRNGRKTMAKRHSPATERSEDEGGQQTGKWLKTNKTKCGNKQSLQSL